MNLTEERIDGKALRFQSESRIPLRLAILTPEWPTPTAPTQVPFLVQQVRFLQQSGIEVQVFHFVAHRNPLNYWRGRMAWHRFLRSAHFDLVHAHFGQGGLLAIPCPLPLVVTFHGSDLQGIVNAQGRYSCSGCCLRWLSAYVARWADASVIVSASMARYLPSHVYFEVIPCGLDLERFKPRPKTQARAELGINPKHRVVLFGAPAQDPVKRYSLAQAAVARLPFPADLVVLSGLPHSQVPWYLSAADVLLLTSYHEGSPTVVKEALACNLPIVTVDVGDVRDRLAGLSECAICPADPVMLGAALARVLRSGKSFDGRSTVLDLDERSVVAQLTRLYLRVWEARFDPSLDVKCPVP